MENSMKNNDEIEIDLRQIFIVIMSKIAIILLVGVIFGLAALAKMGGQIKVGHALGAQKKEDAASCMC